MADSVLQREWHPITLATDKSFSVKSIRLLDRDLVLWRSSNGFVASLDRCPHRGAKLSNGWVNEDNLVCPYHGITYNTLGRCAQIPAHPNHLNKIERLEINPLPLRECYGLVWVALEQPNYEISFFPQWNDANFRQVLCGPYRYKASAYRALENFLDVAHFPFVHEGLLGTRQHPQIEPYSVSTNADEIEASNIRVQQPNPDGTGQSDRVTYRYRIHRPLTASFAKTTNAGYFTMFIALTPIAETECMGWMGIALNYAREVPDSELRAFQDRLVEQDITIVESQSPKCPSLNWLDECPLPCDKLAIAYRQWLKQLGIKFGIRD
jgi:phenylpropionate dioxygenase-like ring-hydroxylating dioxygenase large terminal subunit